MSQLYHHIAVDNGATLSSHRARFAQLLASTFAIKFDWNASAGALGWKSLLLFHYIFIIILLSIYYYFS